MKRLLAPFRQWLASRPQLRRKITLIIYRFPALDMHLRNILHGHARHASMLEVDAAHLAQPARNVMQRLKVRMPRR